MSILFAHPMFFAPRPNMHVYERRSNGFCGSPCSSGCSPCAPLLFLAFLLFFPSILRLGFFLLFNFAIAAGIMCIAKSVAYACSCGPNNCDDKKAASACCADPCTESVREALAKEEKREDTRRHDVSSVSVNKTDEDAFHIVVAVPGVRSADLKVDVLENVVHVSGETKRGADIFEVDRRIALPSRALDMETVSASHADGALTLVVKRKASKRIAVVKRDEPVAVVEKVVEKNKDKESREVKIEAEAKGADTAEESVVIESDDEWDEARKGE